MQKAEAAYNLGYNTVEARRMVQYLWTYGEFCRRSMCKDDVAGMAKQPPRLLRECIQKLHVHIAPLVIEKLNQCLSKLDELTDQLIAALEGDGLFAGNQFGVGRCPGMSDWDQLRSIVETLLPSAFRLNQWRIFGQAIAWTLYASFNEDADGEHIREIFVAASALPEKTRGRIAALTKWPSSPEVQPENALKLLSHYVSPDGLLQGPSFYQVDLYRCLRKLHSDLISQLQQLPHSELILRRVDHNTYHAELDGGLFAISYEQFSVLKELERADGKVVPAKSMALFGLRTRVDRLVARLPQPLSSVITRTAGKGGGYSLQID